MQLRREGFNGLPYVANGFPPKNPEVSPQFFRVVPAGGGGNLVSLRSCLYLNDAGFPPKTAGKTGTPSRGRLVGDAWPAVLIFVGKPQLKTAGTTGAISRKGNAKLVNMKANEQCKCIQ
jgi:hypothetical protein